MTGKSNEELLKLAAKAAKIKGRFAERSVTEGHSHYSCGISQGSFLPLWNPLMNCGEALRLACALKMDLSFGHAQFIATVFDEDLSETHPFHEYCHDNDEAERIHAMCRAIVRASAAIGEKMP